MSYKSKEIEEYLPCTADFYGQSWFCHDDDDDDDDDDDECNVGVVDAPQG